MKIKLTLVVITVLSSIVFCFAQEQKEILIIGTVHTAPKIFKNCYKPLLKKAIEFNPDVIFSEDIPPTDSISINLFYSEKFLQISDSLKKTNSIDLQLFDSINKKPLKDLTITDIIYLKKYYLINKDRRNYYYYKHLEAYGAKPLKKATRNENLDLTIPLAINQGIKYIYPMDYQQKIKELDIYWTKCDSVCRIDGEMKYAKKIVLKLILGNVFSIFNNGFAKNANKQKYIQIAEQLNSLSFRKTESKDCNKVKENWDDRNFHMVENVLKVVEKSDAKKYVIIVGSSHIYQMRELLLKSNKKLIVKTVFSQNAITDLPMSINAAVTPLTSLEYDKNLSDLEKISSNFDKRRIVAMGEASHGAAEFFKMKTRFFRYLVEYKGFRIFAIESTMGTTYALNRYLTKGEGNKQKALAMLDNGVWNTVEVMQLVDWVREWNIKHTSPGDQVIFAGFDINSPGAASRALEYFISRYDPVFYSENKKDFQHNLLKNDHFWEEVETRLKQQKIIYLQTADTWEYLMADISIQNVAQSRMRGAFGAKKRDDFMSENVKRIVESTDAKVFIWAHNYHVSKKRWFKYATMGEYLAGFFGDQYYVIGFDFEKGEIRAKKGRNVLGVLLHGNKEVICETAPPHNPDCLTARLAALKQSLLWVDLEAIVRNFAPRNMKVHNTDEWFSPHTEYLSLPVLEAYNALIFIDNVSPSIRLR